MFKVIAASAAAGVALASGSSSSSVTYFYESFESGTSGSFKPSEMKDYSGQEFRVEEHSGFAGDFGLVLAREARRYASTAMLASPLSVGEGETLVVQYDVRFKDGLSCGGAYIKLYESLPNLNTPTISPETPYTIMFGPDRCGATDKVHLILNWKNPVNSVVEEKHLTKAPRVSNDKVSHLYTLILRPDDTYTILIDELVASTGSLNTSFNPAILPEPEIDDPSDVKPSDWVDEAQIDDASASKPADWDEDAPQFIVDETAHKPADWLDDEPLLVNDPEVTVPPEWDEEEDGVFIFPQIPNPRCEQVSGCGPWEKPLVNNENYKGKWKAPKIPNPAYKGPWHPRRIPNPVFYEHKDLYRLNGAKIGAIGIEVWSMNANIVFDNFYIGNNETEASLIADRTWKPKFNLEREEALKEAEEKERAARLAVAQEGGFIEQLGYYVWELQAFAINNPVYGIVGVVTMLVLFVVTLSAVCSTRKVAQELRDEAESEQKAQDENTSEEVITDQKEDEKVRQRKKRVD